MRKIFILLVFSLFVFVGCRSSQTENDKKITQCIDRLVKDNQIPGLNLSIIYKDGKQTNYSSGFANVEKKIKMSDNFVLFSGSVGKTYAVAILMQLVDEGKIALDNKYFNYFPEVEWLELLPNIKEITVEMLLQHTSGLPRYVMKPEVWASVRENPDKIWSYKDRMSYVFNDEPIHEAGKGWAYSDTNYILLGMLIEKITGNAYYDEVKSRLFVPGNLANTYPAVTRKIKNLPVGYSKLPEMFKMPEQVVTNGEYIFNLQMEWTGGGIASTTSDLAKWGKMLFEGKFFSDYLLQQVVAPNANGVNIDKNLSYGMGSFIYESKYGKAYGHTGFVPGFVSIVSYYPDHGITMAMQINCDYAKKKMSLEQYLEQIVGNIIPKSN